MVILHIASIQTAVLGGVNLAVPQMMRAQASHATVGFVNLTGEPISQILAFSLQEVYQNALPEPFCHPDLVVFHEVYRPAFLKLSRFFTKKNIPYLVIPHGCLTKTAQHHKRFKKAVANLLLFRQFLKGACAIQYLSKREQSQSQFSYPSFVAENGVALPDKKKNFTPSQTIRLVYIGRLDWKIKGLDLLLTAVSKHHAWFLENHVTLSLYGPDQTGEHTVIRRFLEQHGIADCVSLHREVTGTEKENTLLLADYFIQTSRSEGMPMGLLEALSYELPVIVTEGTGFCQMVSRANCGFGCQTSVDGIFSAIQKAAEQYAQYPKLSHNAGELVRTRLEQDLVSQKTVSLYEAVISPHKE